MPAGLGSVDVAHAGDERLIEQCGFDWAAFPLQTFAEFVCAEILALWFGAEPELGRLVRRVPSDGAEGARVHEDGAAPVAQVEGDAGVWWQGGVAPAEDPVAVHPEVDEQGCSVVEMKELMLPATFHVPNQATGHGLRDFGRDRFALGGVMGAQLHQRAPAHGATQTANCKLDFR